MFWVSTTLLITLFPLMILLALLIKLTSKGPIIYRQVRCGLYGRRFVLHKFRSMRQGAEDVSGRSGISTKWMGRYLKCAMTLELHH